AMVTTDTEARTARTVSAVVVQTALVAVLVLLTRVVVLLCVRRDSLFNTDEGELVFALLDRFLGVPSNVLIWPAGPVRVAAVPLFSVDFLLSREFAPSPAAFVRYLSAAYREPWHALLLVRLTIAASSSACFAGLYAPFSRMLESRAAGLVAVLAFATV